MMDQSDAEDLCSHSHGSLNCSTTGQPVTPDSVLGTDISFDGSAAGCRGEGDDASPSAGSDEEEVSPRGDTCGPSTPAAEIMASHSFATAATSSSSSDEDDGVDGMASHRLLSMLRAESADRYQVKPNYLHSSVLIHPSPPESKDHGVSERCRRRTCEWMYDICDYFSLQREVVGIALFYVDRYFTITFEGGASSGTSASGADDEACRKKVPVTRRQFQLVALTGLYIAVKLHGESRQPAQDCLAASVRQSPVQQGSVGGGSTSATSPSFRHQASSSAATVQPWNRLKFSLAVCASISRNQFTPREIEDCERQVLRTLDWHVNPVVPSGSIIDSLLLYLPATMGRPSLDGSVHDEAVTLFVYDCAKYLAELSVSVPALSLVYKPSVIAYSSILYALDVLTAKDKKASPRSGSGSGSCFTDSSRREYERLIQRVSSHHFDAHRENVERSKKILQAICPNLGELFTPPSSAVPDSPTSVNKLA